MTWRSITVAGFVTILLCALLGDIALKAAFQAAGIACVVATVVGLRRFNPLQKRIWVGLAVAMGTFFISYGLRFLFPDMDPVGSASASVPDMIDALAFSIAIASAHQLGRVRGHDKDPTTVIDALIVTAGLSAAVWVAVILPYLQNDQLAFNDKLLGVVIGFLSIWLVFVAVRRLIGPGTRNASSRILSLSAFCGMVSQAAATAQSQSLAVVDIGFGAMAIVFVGTAALHPTMVELTNPVTLGISRMTVRRLIAMTGAVLIAPAVLLIRTTSEANNDLAFSGGLIASWTIVTVLVMVRMTGLVHVRERLANVERVLGRATASLVLATDRDSTYDAALDAMAELAGDYAVSMRTSVLVAEDDVWRVVGSSGFQSETAAGRILDATLMTSVLSGGTSPVQLDDTLPLDNPNAGAASWVIAPLLSHGAVRGALAVSSAEPLPSLIVDALGSLASDVSLAVEAAGLAEDLRRRRSEQQFRVLVEHSADVILVVDAEGLTTFVSPATERLLGDSGAGLETLLPMIHDDDRARVTAMLESPQHHGDRPKATEFRVVVDEETRWFEATATDLSNDANINGIVFNARDTSERKAAQAERELQEAHFRSLVQHSSDLTAVLDQNRQLMYVSPSIQSMLGYDAESLIGHALASILHADDHQVIDELAGLLLTRRVAPKQLELRARTADGEYKTLEVTLTDLRDEPSVGGIVMNAHDVTDRKALEQDLRHKVLHDDLTGIANRVLFRDRVDHALKSSRNETRKTVSAVLFIDIDDFKTVNDGLGHDVGDELLKIIAFRLESFVRSGDTAARLGGDEFGVLLEELYSVEDILNASRRLLAILNEPVVFGRREITVTASVGVSLLEEDITSEVLLRNADVAMYHAKQTGKNRVKFFDQEMYVSAFERLELKADLAHAVERNELSLHYQPIIAMSTGKLIGFEALMRWIHPTRKFVSPVSFIPLAEETGLIVSMGAWACNEAFTQLAEWRKKYPAEVGMSVNVSPRQLDEENIVEIISNAITESGVDPSWITLELTESSGLDDMSRRDRLLALRNLGCGIAADDFGTGFASYAALQQLPFTNVKIDRSLITGLSENDARAQAQVRSIVQMGHALGLTITAEGIEDSRQADALVSIGADKGQGYLFGRPAPAAEIEERLRENVTA